VGVTLIFLAVWIVYSLFQRGEDFRLRSRWMLLFDGLAAAVAWARSRLRGEARPFQIKTSTGYGPRTAFAIGVLHGVGAETATQALLFLAVAGMGGRLLGSLMLATFVAGLVASNSLVALATLSGFRVASKNAAALRVMGGVVALFSF